MERFISIYLTFNWSFNFNGVERSVTLAYVNKYDIIFEEAKSVVID